MFSKKREHVLIVGVRADLADKAAFVWHEPYHHQMPLTDTLEAGELYPSDILPSAGQNRHRLQKSVLDLVPQGGRWHDLPDDVAQQYIKGSYF